MTHDDFLPFFPVVFSQLTTIYSVLLQHLVKYSIFRGLLLFGSINTHNRHHYTVIYA